LALIVFAITLFVSAFLLFLVQPMIGKMILPKLGGTPQVWNTCMLFFQTVLLAGYFYTHAATTYLKPRKQMLLHGILLILPLIVMLSMGRPFDVTNWTPPSGSNPIFATLLLLLTVVGVPFFVVSTSAPLLQKWFSFSGDPASKDPYFLYGASNLGSMLSLAAYPFLVEPMMKVPSQTWLWFGGYVVLAGLILWSAMIVGPRLKDDAPAESPPVTPNEPAAPVPVPVPSAETAIQPSRQVGRKKGLKTGGAAPASTVPSLARKPAYDPQSAPLTTWRCIRWALLAAVPSSLMLGVTSYVSTDLSPFPLLWAIPLSLYLLSFILVFAKWPIEWIKEPHTIFMFFLPVAIVLLCLILFSRDYSPLLPTFLSFGFFFAITMALHGELAKDRPAPRHLTLFFLMMSFGGMLGGFFNGMLAPVLFNSVAEYPLAIIMACFLRPNMAERGWSDGLLLDNMPDMQKSVTETSDNFATSFGQKPQGTPFLFSYFLDIAIGLFIAAVAWIANKNANGFVNGFYKSLNFLGFSDSTLSEYSSAISLIGVHGLPILLCLIVLPRSLRFAVGVFGLLFFGYLIADRGRDTVFADRSYFGILKVNSDPERLRNQDLSPRFVEVEALPQDMFRVDYNYLMHGSTYHGRNYQDGRLSRLSTTYYHRFGPVGCIMERYNWFPGQQNTYDGDARLPASLIGMAAAGFGIHGLPLEQLVDVWSEPPLATVGLGTGTMASYVRPFQHMAYYEIDNKIKTMSVPPGEKKPYFTFVKEAGDRGGFIEIIMGDARLSLEKEKQREDERIAAKAGGPTAMRERYYKVIVLDAFSSDAIPVHLITEEAIKLYMSKLAPDGVLCVHTSNRHLNLVRPVADIADALKLDWLRAHDSGSMERERERASRTGMIKAREKELFGLNKGKERIYSLGHFGSEYIMLANKEKGVKYRTAVVDGKVVDRDVLDKAELTNAIRGISGGLTTVCEWKKVTPMGQPIWTDDYQNIVSIMRWGHRDD
jgi:hypothetical protein